MVHIFAAEREFFSPVQDLVKVLTSATLAIFQQGNKRWGQILSVIISCSVLFRLY